MAITAVGYAGNTAGFQSTGVTVDISSLSAGTVTEGDLLVASACATNDLLTLQEANSLGYTRMFNNESSLGSDNTVAMFYKFASASESNPRFNAEEASSHEWGAVVSVFRGVGSAVFDISHTWTAGNHYNVGSNDATPANQSITTVTNGAFVLVHHHGDQGNSGNWTTGVPSGYTLIGEAIGAFGNHVWVAYKEVAVAGTESPGDWTHTGPSTSEWQVWTTALTPEILGGGNIAGTPGMGWPGVEIRAGG